MAKEKEKSEKVEETPETVLDDKKAKKEETKETEKPENDNVKEQEGLGEKLAMINDKYLRLSAEFDNYRKRTLKEKMELTKTAGEQVLAGILPVVDNFERALASMEKSEDAEVLKEGVRLIYSSFKDFLAQNGVKEIECLHCDFDTDLHEAVTKIPAPEEGLKGKVIDCIQKGYMLNDKVMRFAKVVVGE